MNSSHVDQKILQIVGGAKPARKLTTLFRPISGSPTRKIGRTAGIKFSSEGVGSSPSFSLPSSLISCSRVKLRQRIV